MASTPVALPPALPSELLEFVLAHQTYPTTLLICQPRAVFLSSLLQTIQHKHNERISHAPGPESSTPSVSKPPEEHSQRHPLLIPTLHQVATSRLVDLVFIPTVTHFRAYLAVFPDPQDKGEGPPEREWEKRGSKMPLLVIYGVVGLHRDTSEWSAQGLGNSLSACVEAGWRGGRKVVVIEERRVEEVDVDVDVDADGESREERVGKEGDVEVKKEAGLDVWEERVPMLNGSVRRAGLESEEGGWGGRTVEVGRILARWFTFRRGGWESQDIA